MKCRLLYVVGRLHTGGLEQQLYYLLRSMDRDRYLPAVAVWSYAENDLHMAHMRDLGVPVFSLSSRTRWEKFKSLHRLIRTLRPEIVHSYSFYTNISVKWSALGTPAVPIGSIRNDFLFDTRSAGPCLGRLSARWPGEQICNSHVAAENVRRSGSRFVPKRLHVVRNGLDLERFAMPGPSTFGPARLCGIGYLLEAKRWDRVLNLASELKRRGLRFTVEIAGDGPLRERLEKRRRDLGLTHTVEFLGHTDDVPSVLSRATLLVHTADHEGCPNAVMEAMASARAVVALDGGDIPALVEDGKTGYVVRRGDDSMLVDRVMHLINDRDLCQRMGEAGRAKARREFGLERLVAETFMAYSAAGWQDDPRVEAALPVGRGAPWSPK